METIQNKTQIEKKNKYGASELCGNFKLPNIHVIWVPRGAEGTEKKIWKTNGPVSPNLLKTVNPISQRISVNPSTWNMEKTIPRYIIIKLLKISEKENIAKVARKEKNAIPRGIRIGVTADFW